MDQLTLFLARGYNSGFSYGRSLPDTSVFRLIQSGWEDRCFVTLDAVAERMKVTPEFTDRRLFMQAYDQGVNDGMVNFRDPAPEATVQRILGTEHTPVATTA